MLIQQRDRTVAAQTVTNWSVSLQYGCCTKQRGMGPPSYVCQREAREAAWRRTGLALYTEGNRACTG